MDPLTAQPQAIPPSRLLEGTLSFDGYATLGDFVGITRTVRGEQSGGARLKDIHGWVEASVVALKTGNKLRDRDLNKSMESDRHPVMRFDLIGVVPDDKRADRPSDGVDLDAVLQGELTIHGVRQLQSIRARLRFEGAANHVKADFPLNREDYHIGGLSKMFGVLKMDENIVVHVDLRFGS